MDEEPSEPARRPWLPWTLVAVGAAGALWIALLPLERVLPTPERPERTLDLEPGEGSVAPPPEATPPARAPEAAPELPREAPPGAAGEEPAPPAPGGWFEETVPPDDPLSVAPPGLRDTIQRQLAMNGIDGVRVEIIGDRIVTSGAVADPHDRQRIERILRALAPELHHEDQTASP